MKIIFWLILSAAIFISCSDKSEEIVPKSSSTQIAPAWSNGFPTVKTGATSADINVQTERTASIYYVVTSEDVMLEPEQLVTEASSPTLASIVHASVSQVRAKETVLESIPELEEHQSYFAHFLALSEGQSAANETVKKLSFTTAIRQDTSHFFSASENRNINYLIYRPESVFKEPEEKYPVIFFLGGHGETATQARPINVIQNGLLPEYIHKGNDVPMIVMSIQHVDEDWQNELVGEAMDHALSTLPIDKSKIFLVGTSGGAFGVWEFAQEFPERVSAIVPISGGGEPEKACELKNLGVWAFTNHHDDLVPPGRSIAMIKAINECSPSREAKLNIFPDEGHDCWRRVFDKNHPDWSKSPNTEKVDIFQWLLTQSRATSN